MQKQKCVNEKFYFLYVCVRYKAIQNIEEIKYCKKAIVFMSILCSVKGFAITLYWAKDFFKYSTVAQKSPG